MGLEKRKRMLKNKFLQRIKWVSGCLCCPLGSQAVWVWTRMWAETVLSSYQLQKTAWVGGSSVSPVVRKAAGLLVFQICSWAPGEPTDPPPSDFLLLLYLKKLLFAFTRGWREIQKIHWAWRDGSWVRSTDSSCRVQRLTLSTQIQWSRVIWNSSSREPNVLFCHLRAIQCKYTNPHIDTHTHK